MGFWGVKSYENDLAHDALDTGFDQIHGSRYVELMDDRNPLPYEKVHETLAGQETLEASLKALEQMISENPDDEGDDPGLAWVGIVVRHAECKVKMDDQILRKAMELLQSEDLDWPRPTERKLRIDREMNLLKSQLSN